MIEKVGLEQRRRGGIKEGKVIKAAGCQDQDPQILLLHFTCTEEEEFLFGKQKSLERRFILRAGNVSECLHLRDVEHLLRGMKIRSC